MLIILPSSSKARGVLTTPTHLGLMLTVCQETVCTDPENNTANFVSIFESQTVSRQSGQVPSQHCIGGRGGGEREQRLSRNVAGNKAFQSFVLK